MAESIEEIELSRSCSVDFVLMGVINYDSLVNLFKASNSFSNEKWRIEWSQDIPKVASLKKSESVLPHEFYERIYDLIDLGVLVFEDKSGNFPFGRIYIYIHDNMCPSFQIRTKLRYECSSSNPNKELLEKIRDFDRMLVDFAKSIGLIPLTNCWTVRYDFLDSITNSAKLNVDNLAKLRNDFFEDEAVNIDSCSLIDQTFMVKMLEEGREEYLVLDLFQSELDFALNRFYYLMLLKTRIKHLVEQLKSIYTENIQNMEEESRKHKLVKKVRASEVSQLLALRESIVKVSERFGILKNQVELIRNFLRFHLHSFLDETTESCLDQTTKGVIQSEKLTLEIFYLGPLEIQT